MLVTVDCVSGFVLWVKELKTAVVVSASMQLRVRDVCLNQESLCGGKVERCGLRCGFPGFYWLLPRITVFFMLVLGIVHEICL
jgi:hypothetical protein